MLTAIRCVDANKVHAGRSHRLQGPFMCSTCGEEALLVKGPIRVHHFRHRAENSHCFRERGESAQHRDCKDAIFSALLAASNVANVEIEKDVGSNVADVFAVIDDVPVAIEIQRSNLDIELLVQRTLTYHEQGIFVLWVALAGEEIAFAQYSPKAWERWCHATYGGRVYYWVGGQTLQPVHFDPHIVRTPEYKTRDAAGQPMTVGGYEQRSKRYRNPNHGPRVEISAGFRPVVRRAWAGGTVTIPCCSIYVDRHEVWWEVVSTIRASAA